MKLGQEVKAAAHLVRKTIIKPGQGWGWAGKEWHRSVYPEPRTGVLVGLRTIADGHRVNLGDEGIAFKPTARHQVALVSFDLRRAPRFVLLADLNPIPSGHQGAAMTDHAAKQDQAPKLAGLTDAQCDEFRRLPLSFNDMVRAIYADGEAAALERARAVCEGVQDEYARTEGRRYPELKSDAETGAGACEAAIRSLIKTSGG